MLGLGVVEARKAVRRMTDPKRFPRGTDLVAGDCVEKVVNRQPVLTTLDGQADDVDEPRGIMGPSMASDLLARLEEGAGGRFQHVHSLIPGP